MTINQNKIKRVSAILHKVFIVFYWVGVVVAAIGSLFYVAQFFMPRQWFRVAGDDAGLGLTIDNTVYFHAAAGEVVNAQPFIQALAPFAIAIMVMLLVGIKQVMLILKSVAQDNPFALENASRLSIIGFDLLIASFVVSIAKTIAYATLLQLFGMHNVTSNFSIDPVLLLTGFLVLILSGVFKYGNYLKSEYDATV
ncbi:MAG: DUF2975 domain-containing protein [Clostridia bacterium]|nr:DUF2975 domain-containing protein [Clostridia bacterium]